ncbi:protein tyrosine phosphatase [uncultured Rhodoblastus sp.]|uniref:tyrosine phosphatase family protein n=1 Tax=uncultured Rhodoblastus sp. TaxID=543037 RepID=UPI0025D70006|nr:protein tyrosine phosphatase [uncultured Rhodoblastus sp.]
MGLVYVCPLSRVEQVVAQCGADSLVSLLSPPYRAPRLAAIARDRHLAIGLSDIVAPMAGQVLPESRHVESLIAFFQNWDRARPLVVHCYAGVSRSPAAAFIGLCALEAAPEIEIARNLRRLSPSATPNKRLVELADALLSRDGRMVAAIESIGRGADCFEGEVFWMETA